MDSTIKLSEILGAISVATALGIGAPAETGIGAALVAGRLGRALGLTQDECAEMFFASLLRFIGCSIGIPEAHPLALGDNEGFQRSLAMADLTNPDEIVARLGEHMALSADEDARQAAFEVIRGAAGDPDAVKALTGPHCQLGARLATEMQLPPAVAEALDQVYERWDGNGAPVGIAGDAISLPARVLHIAGSFELLRRSMGVEAAFAAVKRREGGHFDPALCEAIDAARDQLLDGLDAATVQDAFLDEAPGDWRIAPDRLVDVARACGENVDHRSVYTLGHSSGVAALAAKAGEAARLDVDTCEELLIAGHLHDIGRVGVPAAILDKSGPLTRTERARVEQHTFLTDTILRAAPALERYARLASSHHERLDGSGYHRQMANPDLPCSVLAAADCYHAMLEERPHRPALGAERASEELCEMAEGGKLNRMAVQAVLEAVDGRVAGRRSLPAGLTKREAEVICLIARGMSNKAIGAKLFISAKTVEHHVSHVYDKIGIRNRPGAAMFAVEHGLVADQGG